MRAAWLGVRTVLATCLHTPWARDYLLPVALVVMLLAFGQAYLYVSIL